MFTYSAKSWVLEEGDRWTKVPGGVSKGKKVAEYAGPDGCPVALKESDLTTAAK